MQFELPLKFFIFCNNNYTVQYNLQIVKSLTSAGIASSSIDEENLNKYITGELTFSFYSERQDGICISPYVTTLYKKENNENVILWEERLEQARLERYKYRPSRFFAIMAFSDLETCHAVSEIYEWDIKELREFVLIPSSLNKVSRHDMEIISVMRYYNCKETPREVLNAMCDNYWSGTPGLHKVYEKYPPVDPPLIRKPIWEWLIEGRLKVVK